MIFLIGNVIMVIKLPDTIIYIKNCSATRVFNIGHRKMKNSISQSLGAIFHSKQKLICLKKKIIKNRSRVKYVYEDYADRT